MTRPMNLHEAAEVAIRRLCAEGHEAQLSIGGRYVEVGGEQVRYGSIIRVEINGHKADQIVDPYYATRSWVMDEISRKLVRQVAHAAGLGDLTKGLR